MIYRINFRKSDGELKLKWLKKSSTNGVLMDKVYDLNIYGYVELYKRNVYNPKFGNYVSYTYLFDDEFEKVENGFSKRASSFYPRLKKFYREYLINKLINDI